MQKVQCTQRTRRFFSPKALFILYKVKNFFLIMLFILYNVKIMDLNFYVRLQPPVIIFLTDEFRLVEVLHIKCSIGLIEICYPGEGSPALIAKSFTRTARFLLFGFAPGRDAQKLSTNLFTWRLFVEDNGSKWAWPKVARCYSEFDAMNLGWRANHLACVKEHTVSLKF